MPETTPTLRLLPKPNGLPMAITHWLPSDQTDWRSLSYILYVAFGLTSAITLAWVVGFERRSLAQIGLNGRAAARFGRGYVLRLAYLAATVGVIWLTGSYAIEAPGMGAGLISSATLLPVIVLLLGFIVQGSTEEIVFRGWRMSLIASRHGLVLRLC